MDDGDTILRTVLNSGGIAMLPSYLTGRYVRSRALVPVMNDQLVKDFPIHAVTPVHQHKIPKIEAMITFLKDIYSPVPYWESFNDNQSDAAKRASL